MTTTIRETYTQQYNTMT